MRNNRSFEKEEHTIASGKTMNSEEVDAVKKEIDKLKQECQHLRAQNIHHQEQERQLLFLVLAFILGFILARFI